MEKLKYSYLWIVLVVLFTLPAVWNLLRSGFFPMQDDLQAFRIQQMDKCFQDGQIPCRWVPDAGYRYGYPQFNYYPPSVYYVGAIMHNVGFQYIDAVKILFVLGYIASAVAMFVLVDSLIGSWPAFVSSILYTYVPYKAVEVYVRGAMSEFWALTFFPLILWSIYMLIKNGSKKYFILFSLFLGLLLTTHNLMSLIFAPVAIIWALFWLIAENNNVIARNSAPKQSGLRLPHSFYSFAMTRVFLSGLLGLGLASFFFLPVLFEKNFVHVDSMLSGYFDYRAHFVNLFDLFLSREWGYGSSGFPNELLNLSIGIVQWVAGLGAFMLAVFNYRKTKNLSLITILVSLVTLFSIFMIHMKSSFIWALLPPLWYMQFPWRFLAVGIFLFSILGGLFVFFCKKYQFLVGGVLIVSSVILNIGFFVPKDWVYITDNDKFSGVNWQKQMTISIFDYLPISATLPPINEAPLVPEIMDGKAEISNYVKGSDFQTGRVKVLEDATIRIPLFDFPGMQVKVNGKVVPHYNNDCRGTDFCYGLISFKLDKGEYDIDVRLNDTPIRRIGNYVSLISIAIVVYLIFKKNVAKN